ncbi:MAG: hypothetical protein H6752_09060 [Candidatus Omnitrophica bacterium]|nr:hypothetical protein [Candidatus Omnitrophota bacterium]
MPTESKWLSFFDLKTTKQIVVFSGIVSAILTVGLSWYGLQYRPIEHFDAPEFLAIKEEIKQNPTNENLIAAFRQEDLMRREGYFESRRKLEMEVSSSLPVLRSLSSPYDGSRFFWKDCLNRSRSCSPRNRERRIVSPF